MTVVDRKTSASQQIAERLRQAILEGELAPGQRLPSTRDIASRYRAGLGTIHEALRQLEAEQFIECQPRLGGFVKARAESSRSRGASAYPNIGVLRHIGIQDEIANETWGRTIVDGAEKHLVQNGYHLTVYSFPLNEPHWEDRLLPRISEAARQRELAGLIIVPTHAEIAIPKAVRLAENQEIPYVTVGQLNQESVENFIAPDDFARSWKVGSIFARLGFKRVVLLGTSLNEDRTLHEVFAGFIQGWVSEAQPLSNIDYVSCGDKFSEDSGCEKILEHIDRRGGEAPDGIYAFGDRLAIGAINACAERGIAVPDRTSIVGSTGLTVAEHSRPKLSVAAQRMDEMGREAAKMLLEQIATDRRRFPGKFIPGVFEIRESLKMPEWLRDELTGDMP